MFTEHIELIPLISFMLAMGVFLYVWPQRRQQGGLLFSILSFLIMLWNFGFYFYLLLPGLEQKIFWANVQLFSVTFMPVAALLLALIYGKFSFRVRSLYTYLLIIPLMTNLVIWTDPWHHLFRGEPFIDTALAPFPLLVPDYGIWFNTVHLFYTYLLYILAFVLLLRGFRSSSRLYRQQRLFTILAFIFPIFVGTLYVMGISPVPHLDLTPDSLCLLHGFCRLGHLPLPHCGYHAHCPGASHRRYEGCLVCAGRPPADH